MVHKHTHTHTHTFSGEGEVLNIARRRNIYLAQRTLIFGLNLETFEHSCFSLAMKRGHDETTDWSLYFICQKKSKKNLRSTSEGIDKLSSNLVEFYRLGSLKINISRISTFFIGDDPNIKETLETNPGLYRHDCALNYKNDELEALKKRFVSTGPCSTISKL